MLEENAVSSALRSAAPFCRSGGFAGGGGSLGCPKGACVCAWGLNFEPSSIAAPPACVTPRRRLRSNHLHSGSRLLSRKASTPSSSIPVPAPLPPLTAALPENFTFFCSAAEKKKTKKKFQDGSFSLVSTCCSRAECRSPLPGHTATPVGTLVARKYQAPSTIRNAFVPLPLCYSASSAIIQQRGRVLVA
jgi:hypothetical protein